MKFEQIIVHDWSSARDIDGVLNFKAEDVASFTTLKQEPGFAFLRIRGGNDKAYIVKYDDLKAILDKYNE